MTLEHIKTFTEAIRFTGRIVSFKHHWHNKFRKEPYALVSDKMVEHTVEFEKCDRLDCIGYVLYPLVSPGEKNKVYYMSNHELRKEKTCLKVVTTTELQRIQKLLGSKKYQFSFSEQRNWRNEKVKHYLGNSSNYIDDTHRINSLLENALSLNNL